MNPTRNLLIAGAVVGLAAAVHHHHHAHHPRGHDDPEGARRHKGHRHAHGCHGHGHLGLLDRPEWQGLTEAEARERLAERLDPDAIDDAIAQLEERGSLAPAG